MKKEKINAADEKGNFHINRPHCFNVMSNLAIFCSVFIEIDKEILLHASGKNIITLLDTMWSLQVP